MSVMWITLARARMSSRVTIAILLGGCLLSASGCWLRNLSPVALFTASAIEGEAPLTIELDASLSQDPDGDQLEFLWDLDDGSFAERIGFEHTFEEPGVYCVSLRVRDDQGNVGFSSLKITAREPAEPSDPRLVLAVASVTPLEGQVPLTIHCEAAGSGTDRAGIHSYRWQFGDGTSVLGASVAHTYTEAGIYTVTLVATGEEGESDTASVTIACHAEAANATATPNLLPLPVIAVSADTGECPLGVQFDGSASSDSDGHIISFAWAFGDGGTATGAVASHVYDAAGVFSPVLTVFDDVGESQSASIDIVVLQSPGITPEAAFEVTSDEGGDALTLAFDASMSYDPDGQIAAYKWQFGDGEAASSSEVLIEHTYLASGTYDVILEVEDDTGLTGSASSQVTIAAPLLLAEPQGVPSGLYVGTSAGLCCFNGSSWTTYTVESTGGGLISNSITCVEYCEGFLYVGTREGFSIFDGEDWVSYLHGTRVKTLFAAEGAVYVGCWGERLAVYDGTALVLLPNAPIHVYAIDVCGGSIYAGTDAGLRVWNGFDWVEITERQGLMGNHVHRVLVHDGLIYAGTNSGLSIGDGTTWAGYDTRDGLPSNYVTSLNLRNGLLYVGTKGGLCKYDGASWSTEAEYLYRVVFAGSLVYATKWGEGLRVYERGNWSDWISYTVVSTAQGLASDTIYAICLVE